MPTATLGSEELRTWNEEYIAAELARLALSAAIAWERQGFVPSTFALDGWQSRLDELLRELSDTVPPSPASERRQALHQGLMLQEARCEDIRQRHAAEGRWLPIDTLVRAFELSRFEEQVIQLALCHAADSRLGWIVAAFRGHQELDLPTVSLALSLFAEPQQRVRCMETLLPSGRLRSLGLLMLGQPAPGGRSLFVPFQERPFHLPDWLLTFLLGAPDFLRGQDALELLEPSGGLGTLVLAKEVRKIIDEELLPLLKGSEGRSPRPALIQLHGPSGTSRRSVATALCAEAGLRLAQVDPEQLGLAEEPNRDLLALSCATARVCGAGLLFHELDGIWKKSQTPDRTLTWLLDELRGFPGPVFFTGERAAPVGMQQSGRAVASCACVAPTSSIRAELWTRWLPEGLRPKPAALERVARRFLMPPGEQRRVALDLVAEARSRGQERRLTEAALFEACERAQRSSLKVFGELVESGLSWSDLILDKKLERRFDEIRLYARYRRLVFREWGFGRRYPRGQGLSVLLSGPPGTGKTMAAELLAQELKKPLFRADISRLVDKYIGETEKQLAKLFDTAEASDTILLFDEADSLFGKRVAVKSSTDRYSNLSVNFLLQRIEAYPGVVLLTTNYAESIDPAFRRRLTFIVEFREPDEDQRSVIWKKSIPPEAPLSSRISWRELGEDFELTGGHIKNAALRAALRAAKAGTNITMSMLCREANRELESRGRLVRD